MAQRHTSFLRDLTWADVQDWAGPRIAEIGRDDQKGKAWSRKSARAADGSVLGWVHGRETYTTWVKVASDNIDRGVHLPQPGGVPPCRGPGAGVPGVLAAAVADPAGQSARPAPDIAGETDRRAAGDPQRPARQAGHGATGAACRLGGWIPGSTSGRKTPPCCRRQAAAAAMATTPTCIPLPAGLSNCGICWGGSKGPAANCLCCCLPPRPRPRPPQPARRQWPGRAPGHLDRTGLLAGGGGRRPGALGPGRAHRGCWRETPSVSGRSRPGWRWMPGRRPGGATLSGSAPRSTRPAGGSFPTRRRCRGCRPCRRPCRPCAGPSRRIYCRRPWSTIWSRPSSMGAPANLEPAPAGAGSRYRHGRRDLAGRADRVHTSRGGWRREYCTRSAKTWTRGTAGRGFAPASACSPRTRAAPTIRPGNWSSCYRRPTTPAGWCRRARRGKPTGRPWSCWGGCWSTPRNACWRS